MITDMALVTWGRKETKRGWEQTTWRRRHDEEEGKWRRWNRTKEKRGCGEEQRGEDESIICVRRGGRWQLHRKEGVRQPKTEDEAGHKEERSCLKTEWLTYNNSNLVHNAVTKAPLPWQRTKWCCCCFFLLLQNINQRGREGERHTRWWRDGPPEEHEYMRLSGWVAGRLACFLLQLPTSKTESDGEREREKVSEGVRGKERKREGECHGAGTEWAEKKKSHHAKQRFKKSRSRQRHMMFPPHAKHTQRYCVGFIINTKLLQGKKGSRATEAPLHEKS